VLKDIEFLEENEALDDEILTIKCYVNFVSSAHMYNYISVMFIFKEGHNSSLHVSCSKFNEKARGIKSNKICLYYWKVHHLEQFF